MSLSAKVPMDQAMRNWQDRECWPLERSILELSDVDKQEKNVVWHPAKLSRSVASTWEDGSGKEPVICPDISALMWHVRSFGLHRCSHHASLVISVHRSFFISHMAEGAHSGSDACDCGRERYNGRRA